nr:YfhO family protein [Lachnospiraceae bacterium]
SLSMCYTLIHLKGDREYALMLSICYGLSAYVVVYNELFQYYTNIIILPLIYLFLKEILEGKKGLNSGYILLLSYSIINNYYTGYMICIFLVIYVIYYLISEKIDIITSIKRFLYFAGMSLISAGLSCITLLPAVLSLSGEKNKFALGLYLTFNPLKYFSKLYTGSFAGDFGAGMPNIYCGIIVTLMIFMILLNKNVEKRKRICLFLMLILFYADFCINTTNVVWHGFNQPIGFPYRQAFVVIFFAVTEVYSKNIIDKESIEIRNNNREVQIKALAALAVFILYSIYVYISKTDNTDIVSIIITAIVLVLEISVLYMRPASMKKILLFICIFDLSFNAYYSLYHFSFTKVDEFRIPLERNSKSVGYIKEKDNGLYRIEKMFRRTHNDAMMLDYPGLTHFSSSEKKATIDFMGKLGFRNNENWAMYSGYNTALADTFLGVKYEISQFDSSGKPYELIYEDKDDEYYIYENPYVLPFVVTCSDNVYSVDLGEDPFMNQNMIADAMNGKINNILKSQDIKRTDISDNDIKFEIKVNDTGLLYSFFSAEDFQDAVMYVNGEERGNYFTTYDWSVIDLNDRKKDDTVEIEFIAEKGKSINISNGYAAVIDNEALKKWSEEIKEDEATLNKVNSSEYTGAYDTDRNTILFSLPSDKGWHLYVDGEEYELKNACQRMMAADVEKGHHEILLKFIPPGKIEGIIISCAFGILLILYFVIKKFFIKKQKNH